MAQHLEGVFEVTSWSEEPSSGLDGTVKVTTTRIGQRFGGGIEGETVFDAVMTYREDGTAEFVGHQRVLGRIGERSGSFVFRGIGTFDGKEARTNLEVIRGSGTGDLEGIQGSGVSVAPIGSSGTFSVELEL